MSIEYEPSELIEVLRQDGRRMLDAYFRPHGDIDALIDTSVEGNTFRAFHGQQPARVFREWAHSRITPARILDLGDIRDQHQMDELLSQRSMELNGHWQRETRNELRVGPRRKLVNLLHKSLLRADLIEVVDRERVIPLLHVPHDKFCLAAVRKAAASGEFGTTMSIPPDASMGFITDEPQYEQFQLLVRNIAQRSEVPPIAIDLLAWDRSHGRL
jgi:hypothetical protein